MDGFGDTINGLTDSFCRAFSYGLQYGVPLDKFIEAFWHMAFKPQGFTDDPDVKNAPSIPAYVVRKIALTHFSKEWLMQRGLVSVEHSEVPKTLIEKGKPIGECCHKCGTELIQTGRCKFCLTFLIGYF